MYAKIMNSSLLTRHYFFLKHLKDRIHNVQNRSSGEISSRISESIIMMYDLVVVIFTIPLHIWPRKQGVPVPRNIMGYRTENLCYFVVISAQVMS